MNNPFGATRAEAEALDALIETRHAKKAADILGLTPAAYHARIKSVKRRMKARGLYEHVLLWDRWRKGEGKGVPA